MPSLVLPIVIFGQIKLVDMKNTFSIQIRDYMYLPLAPTTNYQKILIPVPSIYVLAKDDTVAPSLGW